MADPHEPTAQVSGDDTLEDALRPARAPFVPLGASVLTLLRAPALLDTFRALFDQELLRPTLGWPRLVSAAHQDGWLRASDVLVELAHSPAREPLELGIVLHAESATRLVDCVLGGPGSSALASAAGQPSEAECGVLAYAAARLCAAQERSFIVRDVRCWGSQSLGTDDPFLLWPLSLRTSLGPASARGSARNAADAHSSAREQGIEAALLLSPGLAAACEDRHELEVLARDFAAPDALIALALDDILVSDAWTLTATTEGLAGEVTLAVVGSEGGWSARLADGRVYARTASGPVRPDQAELVLARHPANLLQLAQLASGAPRSIPELGRGKVSLRSAGRTLAQGELVSWRGALGIRITALP